MTRKEEEEKPKENAQEEPAPAEEGKAEEQAAEEKGAEDKSEEEPSEDAEEAKEDAAGVEQGEKEPSKEGEEGSADGQKEKEKGKEQKQAKSNARTIVRIGSKDLDGNITVGNGLKYVPGVSFMYANAVSTVSGLGDKKVGDLSEEELKKIEDIIANPDKYGIKTWLYNRRFDPEDGADRHIIAAQLELKKKMDINELKKRKCYRGVRHIIGLPVRGQRTRSSFRRAATVGVSRVKAKPKPPAKK